MDLSKLSDTIKNGVVKKVVYDKLAAKENNIEKFKQKKQN